MPPYPVRYSRGDAGSTVSQSDVVCAKVAGGSTHICPTCGDRPKRITYTPSVDEICWNVYVPDAHNVENFTRTRRSSIDSSPGRGDEARNPAIDSSVIIMLSAALARDADGIFLTHANGELSHGSSIMRYSRSARDAASMKAVVVADPLLGGL